MPKTRSRSTGDFGELIAVRFLQDRGMRIADRNVYVDGDEIDIVYRGPDGLVAVEVKTATSGAEPFEALTDAKVDRVLRAASGYRGRIVAVEAIGVSVLPNHIEVRWLRGLD